MLGRKDFTQDEVAAAKAMVARQLSAYRDLAVAAASDPKAAAAAEALEPVLFGNLVLALDRFFVHRVRLVAGKGSNPVNEVELLTDSLLTGEEFRTGTVIKYKPAETVLQLQPGDRIALTADRFEALATAFFADLEARFRAE